MITSRCPRGKRCESCGIESPEITTVERPSAVGRLCLSLCVRCATSSEPVPITLATAVRLVEQHTHHQRNTL